MLGLLTYNYLQPFLIDEGLFFLLIKNEYDLNRKPKWKIPNPISKKLSLFKVIDEEKAVHIAFLNQYDNMKLECTHNNRIIFSSHNPFPHIKIVEVKRN
jgi:hypothetical protein